MKILFLFQRLSREGLYADLLHAMAERGHQVTALAGTSDSGEDTDAIDTSRGFRLIRFPIPNQFGVGKIRKGLVQLMMEPIMLASLMKHLKGERFDVVAYPTPPVTFANVVAFCRKEFGARSYLMLKDIFPQNAVDLGMMSRGGLAHRYFQGYERRLYRVSDFIGCMSKANMEYLTPRLPGDAHPVVELFPNTIAPGAYSGEDNHFSSDGITRFMFGGNLGKPQAIDFLMDCIRDLEGREKRARFTIIGSGTEESYVRKCLEEWHLTNCEFHALLPQDEYLKRLNSCDVGLVLLNPGFTIPNYPSRTMAYMQMGKPMLAATDTATDIRSLIETEARCGLWCPSDSKEAFAQAVSRMCDMGPEGLKALGESGRRYLEANFTVERSVAILEGHFGAPGQENGGQKIGGQKEASEAHPSGTGAGASHPQNADDGEATTWKVEPRTVWRAPHADSTDCSSGAEAPDGSAVHADSTKSADAAFAPCPAGFTDSLHPSFYRDHVKRLLDIVLSLAALTGLSPIMLVTALLVRSHLGSPVLFTQNRAGKIDESTGVERIFRLYKFRSMTDERDEHGNLVAESRRLTPFGKALRATSLDELPQLLNILKGDMSVIGPRPLHVKYIPRYTPEQRRRHLVRPGLSGLAQVRGRNGISWEDKFRLDVEYVDSLSFIADAKIILGTIRTALLREGINASADLTMSEFMGSMPPRPANPKADPSSDSPADPSADSSADPSADSSADSSAASPADSSADSSADSPSGSSLDTSAE